MTINLIPLIDVFAGPGGLNEGFSSLGEREGHHVFHTVASFEMETSACRTLTLRDTYRQMLRNAGVPKPYYQFIRGEISEPDFRASREVKEAWTGAESRVHQIELSPENRNESDQLIREALLRAGVFSQDSAWVLLGGPPCQAYSLAGRSRRANDVDFEKDKKHFLYEEYLHILREFAPPVFVMENVKGLLSSTHAGKGMFDRIRNDLEEPKPGLHYEIHSLTVSTDPQKLLPNDFVIKSEKYGVPQRRHRVILLGIRRGFIGSDVVVEKLKEAATEVTVREALIGMPKLRSGISPSRLDNADDWMKIREEAARVSGLNLGEPLRLSNRGLPAMHRTQEGTGLLQEWLIDPNLHEVVQHQTRAHMKEDLKRYWFAAKKAEDDGVSPGLREFPEALLPIHRNVNSATRPFEDRFRVQVAGRASTTVVSHIAKDGHYYIHFDPDQMRALTVREAARLQTFPDNYFFMGNRTQQYHQVGNAVPPLLANQIAHVVTALLKSAL